MKVQRYTRNLKGRDLIVGDIHGHFPQLEQALHAVGLDPWKDRLFSVGDLVDRGPESPLALDWLKTQPWFHAVRGNHEDMAIAWAMGKLPERYYAENGGGWNMNGDEAQAVAAAFDALPMAIEVATAEGLVGIVHANCPFNNWHKFTWALANVTGRERAAIEEQALWDRDRAEHLREGHVQACAPW